MGAKLKERDGLVGKEVLGVVGGGALDCRGSWGRGAEPGVLVAWGALDCMQQVVKTCALCMYKCMLSLYIALLCLLAACSRNLLGGYSTVVVLPVGCAYALQRHMA